MGERNETEKAEQGEDLVSSFQLIGDVQAGGRVRGIREKSHENPHSDYGRACSGN